MRFWAPHDAHFIKSLLSRPGGIADLIQSKKHRNPVGMKRQRNMFQTKEQGKTPEKGINETEVSNLFNKEFKVIVIKMLIKLGKIIEDLSENFNKEVENMKRATQS